MSEVGVSPTLTLKVSAATALETFRALTAGAVELRSALAGINQGGSAKSSALAATQSQIRELQQALKASQLQVEALQASVGAQSKSAIQAAAAETTAVKAAERTKREEVRKTLAAQKAAVAEQEAHAQRMRNIQVRSGAMTANDVQAQLRVRQAMIEKRDMQEQEVRWKREALARAGAAEAARVAAAVEAQAAVAAKAAAAAQSAAATQQAAAAKVKMAAARESEAAAAAQARASALTSRSVARGVAGATGTLFLTYGANLPALVAAYGFAAAVKQTITAGAQFDYQMKFTGALADMTVEQVKGLSKEVLEMGTNAVYGPTELAKGMRILQQAGISAIDALKMLPIATKVAQQGETDMTYASELLVGVMREFKLEISDTERIANSLSVVAARTPINLKQMGEAMKQMTGLSDRFNVSMETSAALIGLLGEQKIVGSQAGTFSRRFIEEAYTPRSEGAKALMKELGLNSLNKDGSRKEDIQYIGEVVTALRSLNKASQDVAMSTIFDMRSIKAAAALVSDVTNRFKDLRDAQLNSQGSLDEFSKKLNESVLNEWKKVFSSMEKVAIDLFDGTMKSGLTDLAVAIQGLFDPSMWDTWESRGTKALLNLGESALRTAQMGRLGGVSDSVWTAYGFLSGLPNLFSKPAPKVPKTLDQILGIPGTPGMSRAKSPFEMTAEERAAAFPPKAPTTGNRQLGRRFMDKEGLANDVALWKTLEANATASQNRQDRVIQTSAQNRIAILDAQHRYQLIGEEDYSSQVEAINKTRMVDAVAVAGMTIDVLVALRKKLGVSIKHAADQAAVDKRIADARAHRDELIAASKQADEIRKVRLEGEAKERSRRQAAYAAEAASNVAKLRETGELQRRDARDVIEGAVIPQSEAVQIAAHNAVERNFLTEKARLEKDLEALAAKKDEHSLEQARQIPALLRNLRAQQDIEKDIAAESARANYERQREFDYGWQQAFNSYVENATNAAQNARDSFTAATRAMEDAIVRFAKTGQISIRDFASTVVEELLRIQARKAAAGLMGGITSLFGIGNPFGPTAAAQTAMGSLGTTPLSEQSLMLAAQVRHSGGLIGTDVSPSRMINPSVFAGATRYHTGGLVGSEVPIIAKRGEGVFTPGQMRALAPAGGDQFEINVYVSAESGAVNVQGDGSDDSKKLAGILGAAMRSEIISQQRPGGLLARNAR